MSDRSTTMLLLCAVAALVSAAVGAWSYTRRSRLPAALAFAALNAIEVVLHLGHFAEIWTSSHSAKHWLDALQNIPGALLGPTTLWVAADYTRLKLGRGAWTGLLAVTAIIALVLATSPWHGLVHADAVVQGTPPTLRYAFGFFDFLLALLVYGCAIAAAALLLRSGTADVGAQRVVLALALASPVLVMVGIMTLQLTIDGDRDLAPVSTMMGAVTAAWGLGRHRLFELTPQARSTVIANLPDGVFVIDNTGVFTDLNAAAVQLVPTSVGQAYRDAFRNWTTLLEVVEAGRSVTRDVGRSPRAQNQFFEATLTSFTDAYGAPAGCVLVLRDVTVERERYHHLTARVSQRTMELHETRVSLERASEEKQRAQTQLAASEERFRALFDQVFQLTGVLDDEGRVLACNRASLELAGCTEDDVLGRYFWETAWWNHSEQEQHKVRDAIGRCREGEFVRFQTQHITPAKQIRHIDFSLTPVRDTDGVVVEMIPEGRDVTPLYEERARADALAAQLQQAQRLDSMGRLAGGVAHDFNNVLTVIRCSVDLATEEANNPAETVACLDAIKEAAESASTITRGLLAFGRQQPVQTHPLRVSEVVRQSEVLMRRLIRADIQLQLDFHDEWLVRADSGQLQQVVMNLVINAQDAMPDGGQLVVRTSDVSLPAQSPDAVASRRLGDHVCLEVSDSGVGMSEQTRARVFEPFFTTKAPGQGTGLGLAIVHGVVSQAGGWIDLESAPGSGSTFRVYFPRDDRARTVVPAAPVRAERTGDKRRIWVVDDQVTVLRAISRVLEAAGYAVTSFEDPTRALEAARKGVPAPEVLITDIVMPHINGFELANMLVESFPQLRVLVMSGYAERTQLDQAARLPDGSTLPKPFPPDVLLAAVKHALQALPPWSHVSTPPTAPSEAQQIGTRLP